MDGPRRVVDFEEARQMTVLAECDICGNQHRLKDAAVGRPIRCKACGVQIVVPPGTTISSEIFVEEAGRLRRRPLVQSTPSWTWILIGLVTIGLVGLMIGVLAVGAAFIRFTPRQVVRTCPTGGCQPPLTAKE